MLAMGLTGKITPYKNLFGPFPAEMLPRALPDRIPRRFGRGFAERLDNLFKVDLAPSDCAAIIVEPVQGEGGFYPAPGRIPAGTAQAICDENGIVLIADEIQTGFARTGSDVLS